MSKWWSGLCNSDKQICYNIFNIFEGVTLSVFFDNFMSQVTGYAIHFMGAIFLAICTTIAVAVVNKYVMKYIFSYIDKLIKK